jgi:hypothetical protein
MISKAKNVLEYLASLPAERKLEVEKIRQELLNNLPQGFQEIIAYGMISYVVPLSIYPKGYHCKEGDPLPFISLASQKHYISLYHMGIYADEALLQWFIREWKKSCNKKLDMGKSCIRLKDLSDIPYALIGELATKISPEQWIALYENKFRK